MPAAQVRRELRFLSALGERELGRWREDIRGDYARQARSVCPRTLLIASVTAPPDPEASGGCADYGPGGAVLEPGREGVLIVEA